MSENTMPELPKNGPVNVIGYVRVSGLKQQTEGHSLEAQKKEIRKYCNERGWVLLGIITEVFSGWYLTERKHLMKLRGSTSKASRQTSSWCGSSTVSRVTRTTCSFLPTR